MTSRQSEARRVLTGVPGRDGFLFHDGFNQPVYQAAPGLLGLLEGRQVMAQWKPAIVRWMDEAGHFFNHISHEMRGEPAFRPVQTEIDSIRHLPAPADAKSRFLFHHLTAVARELERRVVVFPRNRPPVAGPSAPLTADWAPTTLSLSGLWNAHYRVGPGRYREAPMALPVNWELLPGITNYSGSIRFTKIVDVPAEWDGRPVYMTLHGVDYFADVWVNGYYVGGHEGSFGPFELDLSPYLRVDQPNLVRITAAAPIDPAGDGLDVTSGWNDFRPESSFPNRKTLVKGTLGHHDAKRGGAWSSLTSQDGNTGGVWNDVTLAVRNPVHFDPLKRQITTLSLAPTSAMTGSDEWTATVLTHFGVRNTTDHPVDATIRVRFEPANFEGDAHELVAGAVVAPGSGSVTQERQLSPVRIWRPRDHGFPHLYRVRATLESAGLVDDQTELVTGFRTLAVSAIGESTGANGSFVVNGTPVFVRGTNLLPTYWLSEYDDEAVSRDFRMLREAGFNAVLLHNLVAPKRFYDHANREGFLIVQMFPLQWTYEQSPEFVARAKKLVQEMAAFLYNEPAVVSYEVHNEPDMRTAENLDNRLFDFELHAVLRRADPYRWATTYSSGNHAYPGQFYPLRDDNSFRTLPARFEEEEFQDRRISRHRNMPTEFGIQAMPHRELFEEILSESRVRSVLARLRNDPRWVATGQESWATTRRTIEAIKDVLGAGSWTKALELLDWGHIRKLGQLRDEINSLKAAGAEPTDPEVLSRKLALLLCDTLHYGGFKGENFWFGAWRPAATLTEFVGASQDRQYRLHKDAIENYLNAGVTGPVVGYFSFMFRDADWQAPTWGVVDAGWVPKKAYRAYLESNHPVRVTLPRALRASVKLPGDPWMGAATGPAAGHEPWADSELIVANDTCSAFPKARIDVWLEDHDGARLPLVDRSGHERESYQLSVDLPPRRGFSYFERLPRARASDPPDAFVVGAATPGGTYHLKASVSTAGGETLSTNSYELLVPDTTFPGLEDLSASQTATLLDGVHEGAGFNYWDQGRVVHRAPAGVRGLLAGLRQAQDMGLDLHETTQGEHLVRHIVAELDSVEGADLLLDTIHTIHSEIVSPAEKTAVLLRYLRLFAERAEQALATAPSAPSGPERRARAPRPRSWSRPAFEPADHSIGATPVGSDRTPRPPGRHAATSVSSPVDQAHVQETEG